MSSVSRAWGHVSASIIAAAVAVLWCGAVAPVSAAAARSAREVMIGRADFTIGAWHYRASARSFAPSFGAMIAALGRPSRCRLGWPHVKDSASLSSTATWVSLGIRAEFTTLGGFPDGRDNGCNSPGFVLIDNALLTGAGWHTRRGLRVGDWLTRLRRLYPRAREHADGWWLQAGRSVVSPPQVNYGQLRALVKRRTVRALVIQIDGEGD